MISQPIDKEHTVKFFSEINCINRHVGFSQGNILVLFIAFIKIIKGLLFDIFLQGIIVAIIMIGVGVHINNIERTKGVGVMKSRISI